MVWLTSSSAPERETSRSRRTARRAGGAAEPKARNLNMQAAGLVVLFVVALAIRLIWIFWADVEPTFDDDTGRYQVSAENLSDGHGFALFIGQPTAFWPVGYPATLAALYTVVGKHYEAALGVNALAGAATAVLTFFLASQVFGKKAGWLAGAAVAVFPSHVFFSSLVLTEVPYTALFIAIVLALLSMVRGNIPRWPLLVGFGLVVGYATLVRSETLLLPAVAMPFVAAQARNWRPAVIWLAWVAAGMALVIVPWTARNAIEMRAFVPLTTNAGVNLWIGHHEGADGRFALAGELFAEVRDEFAREGTQPDPQDLETRNNQVGLREAIEFALTNPVAEVRLAGQKLWWMFNDDEEAIRWNETHGGRPFLSSEARSGLLALSNVTYFILLASFVIGVLLWLSKPDLSGGFLLAVLGYWTAVHLVFFGDARYHFPMVPIMAAFAALAWSVGWERLRQALQPAGSSRAQA
jgi:4-amino-4-deoxy-L-arabinose transferase-like glycosyltransferase